MLFRRLIKRCLASLLILAIASIVLVFSSASATATVLFTADTSGSVIVQSRRTLRDQQQHSWQVVIFKPINAEGQEGEVYLRLVGFPGTVEIDHTQPIRLIDPKGGSLPITNISDRISQNPPQPHVGQYNLQDALPHLSTEYRLQLDLPTVQPASANITLQISPAQIEEWQTVANAHAADLACNQFPTEALQNSAFPGWVKCSQPHRSIKATNQSRQLKRLSQPISQLS